MTGLSKIRIKPGEHVAILGMTGGGKSVIADFLMDDLDRIIVIDPKNEWRKKGFRRKLALEAWWRDFRLVWAPKRGDDLTLAALLRKAWLRKNLTIYVDELQSLVDFFPRSLEMLDEIIRTGRSRRVSVWWASQRPAWVPRWYVSESRHKFIFTLLDKSDRKRATDFIGGLVEAPLELHDFLYHTVGLTSAVRLTYNLKSKAIETVRHVQDAIPEPVQGNPVLTGKG